MSVRALSAIVVSLSVSLAIAGCDQTGTIFKQLNINDGTGVSLDARQRTILVKTNAGPQQNRDVVCAEPSPDAMVARAAAIAAQAGGGSSGGAAAQGGFSSSSAESAASIGLRTQTITILRDMLYRACEGFMNGVISEFEYNAIVVNMDKTIVNALATDGLAGTPVAPAVTIGTEAGGSAESEATGGTGRNEDGSQQTAANSTGEVETNAGATTSKIQTISSKTGVNKDTAEALTRVAIGMQNQRRLPVMCMSLLAHRQQYIEAHPAVVKFCKHLFRHAVHSKK